MLDVSAFSQVLHLFLLITVSPMATNKTQKLEFHWSGQQKPKVGCMWPTM